MKKLLVAMALFLGISAFSPFSAEAKNVLAFRGGINTEFNVVAESVYNDGDNFGCQVIVFSGRKFERTSHTYSYYFELGGGGTWYCYRDGKEESMTEVNTAIFNTAMEYRP